ncbi:MAG: hypothetical protein IIB31_08205, partial [Chloroflexi bacterium]|nr:hypothetical protein [Chloroflexota bacterium]
FSRIFSFGLFMALAGLTSYFAWKHLRQDDADSTLAIALISSAFVALLFALWGRDLIRSVRKVGTAGIEFEIWQEIARIPDTNYLEKDYIDIPIDLYKEEELSGEQLWKYERAMGHYLHLEHRGVDVLE